MKKLVSLLAAVLLLVSLAACGGSTELLSPDQTGGAGNSGTQTPAPTPAKVTVEPAVLLDQEGIKIELKSLDADALFGPELKVLIENTTDQDLTVQCRNSSVNGYMVETMFSAEVAAGKKANDGIAFMSSDLELCGVQTIADLEFSFHIFTTEDWDTYLDSELVQVKTSAAATYQYTYDHPGTQVYSDHGVELTAKGIREDELLGPGLVMHLYNSGDETVLVQVRDTSVNGFMVETLFSQEVMPGKHAVSSVTLMESDLEENGITEIQALELVFTIMEADSWKTIAETDPVKLTFTK